MRRPSMESEEARRCLTVLILHYVLFVSFLDMLPVFSSQLFLPV